MWERGGGRVGMRMMLGGIRVRGECVGAVKCVVVCLHVCEV